MSKVLNNFALECVRQAQKDLEYAFYGLLLDKVGYRGKFYYVSSLRNTLGFRGANSNTKHVDTVFTQLSKSTGIPKNALKKVALNTKRGSGVSKISVIIKSSQFDELKEALKSIGVKRFYTTKQSDKSYFGFKIDLSSFPAICSYLSANILTDEMEALIVKVLNSFIGVDHHAILAEHREKHKGVKVLPPYDGFLGFVARGSLRVIPDEDIEWFG